MLLTDFHTHILPNIDDGSTSIEEAVRLVHQESEQGVQTICLTPHFDAQKLYPDEFLKLRNNAMEALKEGLKHDTSIPDFILGAEVQFCSGMSLWEQLDQLALGNTGYILIEMPLPPWKDNVLRELTAIYTERNLIPILAHIERYITPFNTNKILQKLSHLPVLLQVNCSFINEWRTRRTAIKLLKAHIIHLIGSDCHRMNWRSPNMIQTRELLEKHLIQDTKSFLSGVENSILRGEQLITDNHSFR